MKIPKIFLLALPLALLACGGGSEAAREESVSAPADQGAPAPATGTEGGGADAIGSGALSDTASGPGEPPREAQPGQPAARDTVVIPRMIIREGTATVEVDSLEPAVARVRQLAARLGGYVGNVSLQGGAEQVRTATVQLKIPAQRYEQAVSGLEPVGRVEAVQSTAQDVGEEFVDVTARTANARRLEERLVTLLATRTGRLEDVLAVERELARVREEIERYEGRLRYLRTRVSVSTLTVTLHEPYPGVGSYPGDNPILDAFGDAWENFVTFVAGFISSLGVLIPLGLILWAAVWLFRKLFGRPRWPGRGPRNPPPPPPPATPAA